MTMRLNVAVELPEDQIDVLVDGIYKQIFRRMIEDNPILTPQRVGWLDTRAAAEYLGCSKAVLHKATAAREIKFEQSTTGGKCWFKTEWLDAWRMGSRQHEPRLRAL